MTRKPFPCPDTLLFRLGQLARALVHMDGDTPDTEKAFAEESRRLLMESQPFFSPEQAWKALTDVHGLDGLRSALRQEDTFLSSLLEQARPALATTRIDNLLSLSDDDLTRLNAAGHPVLERLQDTLGRTALGWLLTQSSWCKQAHQAVFPRKNPAFTWWEKGTHKHQKPAIRVPGTNPLSVESLELISNALRSVPKSSTPKVVRNVLFRGELDWRCACILVQDPRNHHDLAHNRKLAPWLRAMTRPQTNAHDTVAFKRCVASALPDGDILSLPETAVVQPQDIFSFWPFDVREEDTF